MNILISCIGRRGYIARYFKDLVGSQGTVIATSNSQWTPGFQDCDKTFLLPDIASDNYVDAVLDLCKREKVKLLLSMLDLDIHRLSERRQQFVDNGIATFIVSRRVSEICFDKLETVRFLRSKGFPQPQTFESASTAKSALEAGKIKYPVFVKPRFGFGSENLFVARSHDELDVFFNYSNNMLVQEKLAGQEYSFDILNDLEGKVVRVVVKRKVLMRSGETDQALTIRSDELVEVAKQLGTVVGHVGPMDVDLFWDGETPHVLEMNPRFGGGYPLSQLAQAEFPSLIVRMARGEKLDVTLDNFEEGIRMMKRIDCFECTDLVNDIVDLR